jgi:hypothetical protein
MKVGDIVETMRVLKFFARREACDSVLTGEPSPRCIGTVCRVVMSGTTPGRALVQSMLMEDGYFVWVSPDEVDVMQPLLIK